MEKPALILLHGALGAASQFQPWLSLLEQDFRVFTLDFEGHGERPGTRREFAIEHFAENLEQLIQEQGLAPANVFGYSMGGYVALWLAAQKPELIERVFTFASKVAWDPETAKREIRMLDPEKIKAKVPHFAKMLETRHAANNWEAVLHETAGMMNGLGQNNLIEASYTGIKARVRVGLGDRDTMVGLEETVQMQNRIDGAELLILPGTPHPLEKIDPLRICTQIKDFFS